MSTYRGSLLEATANLIAREMGVSITLETPDTVQHSVERGVVWTQPEENRYRYEPPRHQPNVDTSSFDRYVAVDVLIRAPGSERAMLELSDAFLRSADKVLGAQPYGWRFDRDSSGGGAALDDGVWVEQMRILLRYDVVLEHYVQSPAPLTVITDNAISGGQGTADSGLFVEGSSQGENVQVVS